MTPIEPGEGIADKARMMKLPCITKGCIGERQLVAQDENEAVRLAEERKLEAYCV